MKVNFTNVGSEVYNVCWPRAKQCGHESGCGGFQTVMYSQQLRQVLPHCS